MRVRHGFHPQKTHELNILDMQVAAQHPELSKNVRSLDGHGRTHHVSHYFDSEPIYAVDATHAIHRICRTTELFAAEAP